MGQTDGRTDGRPTVPLHAAAASLLLSAQRPGDYRSLAARRSAAGRRSTTYSSKYGFVDN